MNYTLFLNTIANFHTNDRRKTTLKYGPASSSFIANKMTQIFMDMHAYSDNKVIR